MTNLEELARLDRLVAELRSENDVLKQECRERLDHAEFWRRTAIAWQDWAADQLTAIGKQIDGGRWGSEPARKILGEQLQAAEVSAKLLTEQRDAARAEVERMRPVYEAALRYRRSMDHEGPDDELGLFVDAVDRITGSKP